MTVNRKSNSGVHQWSFLGTQPCSWFLYLSMAAFLEQERIWVVARLNLMALTLWSPKPTLSLAFRSSVAGPAVDTSRLGQCCPSGFRDSSGGGDSRLIDMNSSFLKIGPWEKQSLSLYLFHHQSSKELGFVQSASVHLGVWKKIILENGGQKFPPTSPSPPIFWCFSSLGLLITFLYLYLGNWKGQWSVVR